jgi:hypothetical protein
MRVQISSLKISVFRVYNFGGTLPNILLDQGWANYGPRAKYGPLRSSMRPAEGLENAKKNEVSKNI